MSVSSQRSWLSRFRWPLTLGVSALSTVVLLLAFPAFALANVSLTQISSDPLHPGDVCGE